MNFYLGSIELIEKKGNLIYQLQAGKLTPNSIHYFKSNITPLLDSLSYEPINVGKRIAGGLNYQEWLKELK